MNTAYGSRKPATNVPVDTSEEGVVHDIASGAVSIPIKMVNIIQVGATKITPRRAMNVTTMDMVAGSGKPATND